MRLHRNLVDAVVDGMDRIFNQHAYADKAIERLLKRDKRWGKRDRAFIAGTLYDIVRYKRLFAEIAGVREPYSIPDRYRIFAVWAVVNDIRLPDWDVFNDTPVRRIRGKHESLSRERALRESVPDWLDHMAAESLGESLWEEELRALNQEAPVVLRANTLKTDPETLRKVLSEEGIETIPVPSCPTALQLDKRANVFRTQAFRKGWFEVQDASSQKVVPMLGVAPGMRVVDCCAGAGGKTLHLAAEMENKGQIIAMDLYEGKLAELKRRARRAGAFNIETRLITSQKTIKRLRGSADRLLIDAPCSGLGVLRRNPDAKWKLQPEFIENLCRTQQEILSAYSSMVRPGGRMLYATCSILPEENERQIAAFLGSGEGRAFQLLAEEHILASVSGYDGFYMALLERKA